ncbi:M23 family metallopeptidase [Pleionea litopenaei]|uniref:M23 family metallopeptidase n=1 Tax=Pleionea litopenaei TaxID=3070815 RepID=A0AA51RSE9_9GAMM|nr:M23 family metallopeptidase [Pleionea sp. HL-JVS1]WMS86639.1 M23 family metallopeptidase [Pleionea sp. HL-JVS1]
MKRFLIVEQLSIVILVFSSQLMSEDLLINQDTHFKTSTEQSSNLPSQEKCEVAAGTLVSVESIQTSNNHYRVDLSNQLTQCNLSSGYFYQDHVVRESKLITVTQNTVFKKRRLSSSQLPISEKCDVSPGVYAAQSDVPNVVEGHYYLNLRELTVNCSFSQGYFWEGHTQKGSLAIQITGETFLKKQAIQSSELPASDKCIMPVGLYALGAGASRSGETHYQITLAKTLPDCSFNTGFVYFDHTGWKKPYVAPPEPTWSFPLPGGYYTSGWCQCRNIGTSPHIGQDISRSGTKKAVIIQDGRLQSTTFSSSCGYISYVEDDFGTLWRYVHLNRPSVSAGQRVIAGQHLAYISAYPTAGCGSGPHLHLERRSAGYFNDQSTGKSCQNGYRSCYYDPIKPWRSNFSAKHVQKSSITANANWSKFDVPASKSCKVPVDSLAKVSRDRFAQFPNQLDPQVNIEFSIVNRAVQSQLFNSHVSISNNLKNQCASNQRCLVQWQLVAEKANGDLTSIFFGNRVRNIELKRQVEEQWCLPEQVIQYWMLLKDNQGKRWRVPITSRG